MTALLRKSSFNGRWFVASSDDVKVLMGFRPETKWPAEGVTARLIQGITVWVARAGVRCGRGRGRGGIRHRARALCPVCQRGFTLGRLGQHLNVHPDWAPTDVATLMRKPTPEQELAQ